MGCPKTFFLHSVLSVWVFVPRQERINLLISSTWSSLHTGRPVHVQVLVCLHAQCIISCTEQVWTSDCTFKTKKDGRSFFFQRTQKAEAPAFHHLAENIVCQYGKKESIHDTGFRNTEEDVDRWTLTSILQTRRSTRLSTNQWPRRLCMQSVVESGGETKAAAGTDEVCKALLKLEESSTLWRSSSSWDWLWLAVIGYVIVGPPVESVRLKMHGDAVDRRLSGRNDLRPPASARSTVECLWALKQTQT